MKKKRRELQQNSVAERKEMLVSAKRQLPPESIPRAHLPPNPQESLKKKGRKEKKTHRSTEWKEDAHNQAPGVGAAAVGARLEPGSPEAGGGGWRAERQRGASSRGAWNGTPSIFPFGF